MAIPSGTKFHGVASFVDTTNRGSELANSQRDAYTIEDFSSFFSTPYQGWSRYDDTVYTVNNKLTILDGNETTVPNNGGNVVTSPQNYIFYDSSTQKILGLNENDVYIMTVAFKTSAANANQTHLDWGLVGDADISRVSGVITFPKGNNLTQVESFIVQYYTDADFVANGVQMKFLPVGGDVKIWDVIYFIQRTQGYGQ